MLDSQPGEVGVCLAHITLLAPSTRLTQRGTQYIPAGESIFLLSVSAGIRLSKKKATNKETELGRGPRVAKVPELWGARDRHGLTLVVV